jgi:S1-C subfamily serine protease
MEAELLHLSGPRRGEVTTHAGPEVRIGAGRANDVVVDGIADRHAQIEWHQDECCFYLRARDGRVFLNGRQVREVILEHGDLIELGECGPKLRFKVRVEKGEYCKPLRQVLQDARDSRTLRGWPAFVRSFARDMHRRTSLATKIAVPLVLVGLVFGAAALGGFLGGRRPYGELDRLREQLAQLERQSKALASREELAKMRADFDRRAAVVDRLTAHNASLKRVLNELSAGVCLIHGIFGFERPGSDGTVLEMLDPEGDPARFEYTGSGFLASARGEVITNRHVAQPWSNDATFGRLIGMGYAARFRLLEAVFPGHPPVAVDPATIRLRGDEIDLAVLRVAVRDVPALPLSDADPHLLRGEHVVVLGYPTGVNALLAKLDAVVVRELTARAPTVTELIAELTRRNAISPVATQGSLNEVLERQLIYDASTAQGGSGGPVFGPDGTVVGVNFAILQGFTGTNFGIPIRFARELLEP